MIVILLALLLSGGIFSLVMSTVIYDNTKTNMLNTLTVLDSTLDYGEGLDLQVAEISNHLEEGEMRFTVMDHTGKVVADNDVKEHSSMDNHNDREEVRDAIAYGEGTSRRISDTLGIPMLYTARISQDGTHVLRMSIPFSGMYEYLGLLLPALAIGIGITFVLSAFVANSISKSVTKPLNEIADEILKIKENNINISLKQYKYDEINIIAEQTRQMSYSVNEYTNQLNFEKIVRQEFFSNASHELKTPITSIRGYIELIENNLVTDEKQKQDFLSRIKKEINNMTNLINDILMISRLETKEAEVELTTVRICPLLKEVCDSLEPLALEFQVQVETNCKPISMVANNQQIRELFSNLITNAIKYNKPGGKVFITVNSELKELIIVVKDTGVGIPDDAQLRVFERFYRVDKGRSKKMGGTGLGLSIVKHIVNYYGGSIKLESKVFEGTKMIVRLPMNKA